MGFISNNKRLGGLKLEDKRELKLKLKEVSAKTGKSVSQLATEAIEKYLSDKEGDGVESKLLIDELQRELKEAAFAEKMAKAEARVLKKEAQARRKILSDISMLIGTMTKDVAKNRKKASGIDEKKRELMRKENQLMMKERELSEKEAALKKKEDYLKALERHLRGKEEELSKIEAMIKSTSLAKNIPSFVEEILNKKNIKEIGLNEVKEKAMFAFTDNEFKAVVESWPITKENKNTIIRRVTDSLEYRHLKDNVLRGFFRKIN